MKQKQWEKIFRDNTLFEASDPKNAFRKTKNIVDEEVLTEALKWKKVGAKEWFATNNKYDYHVNQGRNLVSLDVFDTKLRKSADKNKADELSYVGGNTFKSVEDAQKAAETAKFK